MNFEREVKYFLNKTMDFGEKLCVRNATELVFR